MIFFCKRTPKARATFVIIALFLAVVQAGVGRAEEKPSSSLEISGNAEFKLKYAWGDGAALLGTSFSPGQADIMQTVALRVRGEIASRLSISADLDNQKGDNLQLLQLRLDADPITARFGGLSVRTQNPYTAYSGRLRGLDLGAVLPTLEARAVIGRVQGVAAKKTFRGTTAQEVIVYEPTAPYGPSPGQDGFLASIEGMDYYVLMGMYDSDFMDVWIRYDNEGESAEDRTLQETLDLWDLGCLYGDELSPGETIAIPDGQFVAVSSNEELLALRSEIRDILRNQILAAIRSYNTKHGLSGQNQMKYPFILGSATEGAFLHELLTRHTYVVAGVEGSFGTSVLDVKADTYKQHYLYDLGQLDIEPGSVEVEIRRGGRFFSADIETSLFYQVHYAAGLIEFDFPAEFFATYDGIRVRYNHDLAMGTFNLGLSIAEGSEQVYLNDVLLQKNADYAIDYELGLLTIFHTLTEDDVVIVEYEYFRGPFGKMADYKANFYGATLSWTPSENLTLGVELSRYADIPKTGPPPSSTQTMPNAHTILGLSSRYSSKGLTVSGDVALSHDQFPFDSNLKSQAANRISGIVGLDVGGSSFTVISHRDGISAGDEGFSNYGVSSGLSSFTVHDLASTDQTLFLATDNGLTVFSSEPSSSGQNPFDYVSNWQRLYTSAGLPSNHLTSVAVTPWRVWIGTAGNGLASADLYDLETWQVYTVTNSGLPSNLISQIVYDPLDDLVIVGSDLGVSVLKGNRFELELPELAVDALWSSDLLVQGLRTFVSGASGVYARRDDGSWHRILEHAQVGRPLSLAVWNGLLWVGSADGLYVWDGEKIQGVESTKGHAITALGVAPGYKHNHKDVLWAAGVDDEGGIRVFELLTSETVFAHRGSELAIANADPRRYVDLSAKDHTAMGYAARTNVSYDLGNGRIYSSYETISPGFTRLNQTTRQARDQWNLGTEWQLGSRVDLVAEHTRSRTQAYSGIEDLETEREIRIVQNKVGATVDLGTRINLSYSTSKIDDQDSPGYEREEHTWSVGSSQSFLDNKLSVSASYEKTRSDNLLIKKNSYVQTNLRGNVTFAIDSVVISASYRKPVKTVDPKGEQEYVSGITETVLNARWNTELRGITLRAYYRHTARNNIATLRVFDDKRAELRAVFPVLDLKGLPLTPSVVLKWNNALPFSGQERQSWEAQGSISGIHESLRTSVGANLKRTTYLDPAKLTLETEIFGTLGIPVGVKLYPQLDVRWKRSIAERQDLGTVVTNTLTGTARLVWNLSNDLNNVSSLAFATTSSSASARWQKVTLTLRDSLTYKVSDKLTATGGGTITSTISKSKDEELQTITWSAQGGFDYRFSERWSLGASLGYHQHHPTRATERVAKGLALETALKATF